MARRPIRVSVSRKDRKSPDELLDTRKKATVKFGYKRSKKSRFCGLRPSETRI
jgi:hypothetical protein